MGAFLDDGDQQVDLDCDPALGFDRVFAGPVECLDAQVLLDPLEEQFNLPSTADEILVDHSSPETAQRLHAVNMPSWPRRFPEGDSQS